MKKFLCYILSALLVLIQIPWSTSQAQTVAQDGQKTMGYGPGGSRTGPSGMMIEYWNPADSTAQVGRTDGNGNLIMTDASRDRDYVWKYTNALQSVLFGRSGNKRDSSLVMSTQGANRVSLFIIGTADSTVGSTLVEFQIRSHPVAIQDTINSFTLWRQGSQVVTASANPRVPSALVDTFNTAGSALNAGMVSDTTLATGSVAVWIPGVMRQSEPRGICIQLADMNGLPYVPGPYMTIRARAIRFVNPSGVAIVPGDVTQNPRIALQVTVVGTR